MALLALGLVLGVSEPAVAAEPPTLTKPSDQRSTANKAMSAVAVKGTGLTSVTAKELPAGLTLTKSSETEWKIVGTPTTVKATVPVTLEATHEALTTTTTLNWTIEASPTVGTPTAQTSTVNTPIKAVTVTGTNLASLTAKELPAGLNLTKVSETEWKIEGTPTAVKAVTNVTLEGTNKATNEPGVATSSFKWTVTAAAGAAIIEAPSNQSATVGVPVSVTVKGVDLAELKATQLPAGITTLTKHSETEWTIEGTPTSAETKTVTLEAENAEGLVGSPATFTWTVNPAPVTTKAAETPSKRAEVVIPPAPKIVSAGRLGTMPIQKEGPELVASFLCEVAICKVKIGAVLTAGRSKFHIRSGATPIRQGSKVRIAIKLTKKQRALIAAALKKHKKVTAAISATIESSVGAQLTKALTVTVER